MTIRIFLVLLITTNLFNPLSSQTLEELSSSVVYLKKQTSSTIKYGTGFFVSSPEYYYLVTAAHVSEFIDENTTITIRENNDKPFSIPISTIIDADGIPKWYKNEEQDLAIVRVDVTLLQSSFRNRFLPLKMLEQDLIAPKRERHLVVMGFPLALGTTKYFSPLTSVCKASSGLVTIKPRNKPEQIVFVIDKPSIEGYSGSPVFLMPWPFSDSAAITMADINSEEGKVKCVGIADSTLSDNTGGKLGAVIPSYYIVEAIKEIEKL